MMQKRKVAIGLGSNSGDRLANLDRATEQLIIEFLQEAQISKTYESKPLLQGENQPHYLNRVVVGLSEWKPPGILNYLKNLEIELGRKPTEKWGSRVIDLDLIAYDEEVFESKSLVVPHREMHNRDFVLVPMLEVWPDWQHPILKKSLKELISALPKESHLIV